MRREEPPWVRRAHAAPAASPCVRLLTSLGKAVTGAQPEKAGGGLGRPAGRGRRPLPCPTSGVSGSTRPPPLVLSKPGVIMDCLIHAPQGGPLAAPDCAPLSTTQRSASAASQHPGARVYKPPAPSLLPGVCPCPPQSLPSQRPQSDSPHPHEGLPDPPAASLCLCLHPSVSACTPPLYVFSSPST